MPYRHAFGEIVEDADDDGQLLLSLDGIRKVDFCEERLESLHLGGLRYSESGSGVDADRISAPGGDLVGSLELLGQHSGATEERNRDKTGLELCSPKFPQIQIFSKK